MGDVQTIDEAINTVRVWDENESIYTYVLSNLKQLDVAGLLAHIGTQPEWANSGDKLTCHVVKSNRDIIEVSRLKPKKSLWELKKKWRKNKADQYHRLFCIIGDGGNYTPLGTVFVKISSKWRCFKRVDSVDKLSEYGISSPDIATDGSLAGQRKSGKFWLKKDKKRATIGGSGDMANMDDLSALDAIVRGEASTYKSDQPIQAMDLQQCYLRLNTSDVNRIGRDQHFQRILISWMNKILIHRNMSVKNLHGDLRNGVILINLVEILSTQNVKHYYKDPQHVPHELENLETFLKFLSVIGLKIDVECQDIYHGRVGLVSGIIFLLVQKFKDFKYRAAPSIPSSLPPGSVKSGVTDHVQQGRPCISETKIRPPVPVSLPHSKSTMNRSEGDGINDSTIKEDLSLNDLDEIDFTQDLLELNQYIIDPSNRKSLSEACPDLEDMKSFLDDVCTESELCLDDLNITFDDVLY